jgi:YHS domain-containing protein
MERKGYTMRNILSLAAAAALTFGLVTGSFAVEAKGAKASPPKCPACKMTLSTKKTDKMSREVKIKGKTYYCCAGCKMKMPSAGGKGGDKGKSDTKTAPKTP